MKYSMLPVLGNQPPKWRDDVTQNGYDLLLDNARLRVDRRTKDVALIFSRIADGHRWTYSVNIAGGKRWRATQHAMEFKDVSVQEARQYLREYASEFRAPGLDVNAEQSVNSMLEILLENS